MNIFKATMYKNGDNVIEPIECEELRETKVLFSRDNSGLKMGYSRGPRIDYRSSKHHIYCKTESECHEWVNTKYEEQISALYSSIANIKERQFELSAA